MSAESWQEWIPATRKIGATDEEVSEHIDTLERPPADRDHPAESSWGTKRPDGTLVFYDRGCNNPDEPAIEYYGPDYVRWEIGEVEEVLS